MKYILLGSPYGPLGFSGYSYGYGLNAQPLYAFLPLYSAIKWNVHTFRILIARHVKLILIAQSCFQVRTQKALSRFADRHPRDQYFQRFIGKIFRPNITTKFIETMLKNELKIPQLLSPLQTLDVETLHSSLIIMLGYTHRGSMRVRV